MLRALILASALAFAAACSPSPDMPADEAYGVLEDFAQGDAPADVCTDEGRALLRRATRAYARAQSGAWPDVQAMIESDGESASPAEMLVLGALSMGFVEPSDVRGPAGAFAGMVSATDFRGDIRDFRAAVEFACSEMFELQQEAARLSLMNQQYQRAMQSAERRSPERVEEVRRRYANRIENARRRIERLSDDLQDKLEEGGYAS